MNSKISLCAVVAVSIGVALSGCSSSTPAGKADYELGDIPGALAYAKTQHWTDIVEVLSDGKITAEEYRSVHEADLKCNEALGWHYGTTVLDPIGGRQLLETSEYRGPKNADKAGLEKCNQHYFNTVEAPYMSQSRQLMDPALLAAVRTCLDAEGYKRPQPGQETRFQDFYPTGKMWSTTDQPYMCTLSSAKSLFPTLPAYGFAF